MTDEQAENAWRISRNRSDTFLHHSDFFLKHHPYGGNKTVSRGAVFRSAGCLHHGNRYDAMGVVRCDPCRNRRNHVLCAVKRDVSALPDLRNRESVRPSGDVLAESMGKGRGSEGWYQKRCVCASSTAFDAVRAVYRGNNSSVSAFNRVGVFHNGYHLGSVHGSDHLDREKTGWDF